MGNMGQYWYKAKQWVIPLAGLAVIVASAASLNDTEVQKRGMRERTSPVYSVPANQYMDVPVDRCIDRTENIRTATQPSDCPL